MEKVRKIHLKRIPKEVNLKSFGTMIYFKNEVGSASSFPFTTVLKPNKNWLSEKLMDLDPNNRTGGHPILRFVNMSPDNIQIKTSSSSFTIEVNDEVEGLYSRVKDYAKSLDIQSDDLFDIPQTNYELRNFLSMNTIEVDGKPFLISMADPEGGLSEGFELVPFYNKDSKNSIYFSSFSIENLKRTETVDFVEFFSDISEV